MTNPNTYDIIRYHQKKERLNTMEKFAVIAKNSMLKQINYIDDLAYACEMYRYLIAEADFPDVKFMDNETGVVLMHYKKETTTYEYIDPDLLVSLSNQTAEVDIDEAINLAETSIEPNGVSEETALTYDEYQAKYNALNSDCRELIDYIFELGGPLPADVVTALEDIYNKINIQAYSLEELLELKKILKKISSNY